MQDKGKNFLEEKKMNYIQTLANLDAKLSRYDNRLEKMRKLSHFDGTFSKKDWDITVNKINKMEMLYSKVGKKAFQQFNKEDQIRTITRATVQKK